MRHVQRQFPSALARLAAIAALLGIGLLPVEYHAGAPVSHAHSSLQLWLEAAGGAIDHHDHGHNRTRIHATAASVEPAAPANAATAPPGAPRLTSAAPAAERAAIVSILILPAAGLLCPRRTPGPRWLSPPKGMRFAPEPPPPRLAALVS